MKGTVLFTALLLVLLIYGCSRFINDTDLIYLAETKYNYNCTKYKVEN